MGPLALGEAMRKNANTLIAFAIVAVFFAQWGVATAQDNAHAYPVEIKPNMGTAGVQQVQMSRDGSLIVTTNLDSRVDLREGRTGKQLRRLYQGRPAFALHKRASINPAGSRVAVNADDIQRIMLYDSATGRELSRLDPAVEVQDFHLIDDHIILIENYLGNDGEKVLIVDMERREIRKALTGRLLGTTPDATRLLISDQKSSSIVLYRISDGKPIRKWKGYVWAPDMGSIIGFARGKDIAAIASNDTIFLLDLKNGKARFEYKTPCEVRGLSITENADTIAYGCNSDGSVHVVDVVGKEETRDFNGHDPNNGARVVTISPDGKRLIAFDRKKKWVLWNVENGTTIKTIPEPEMQTFLGISEGLHSTANKDVTLLALQTLSGVKLVNLLSGEETAAPDVVLSNLTSSGSAYGTAGKDGLFRLWDVTTGKQTGSYPIGKDPNQFALNATAEASIAGYINADGAVVLADAVTGRELRKIDPAGSKFTNFAISPDGKRIVSANERKELALWNVADGSKSDGFNYKSIQDIAALFFSADANRIVVTGTSGLLRAIDSSTGATVRTFMGHTDAVNAVLFLPGGNFISAGSDANVFEWNMDSEQPVKTLSWGYTTAVVPNPDGSRVATVHGPEVAIRNPKNWAIDFKLLGHQQAVSGVAFAPGNRIVTSSDDGTLRFWDGANANPLAISAPSAGGEWVTLTSEGFFDASSDGAKGLNIVRGLETLSIDQAYQALYRPDLVQAKLAGDPQGTVRDSAAKLDLAKVLASGPAPVVTLANSSGQVSESGEVEVEARITGETIGKVEWSVNGVTVALDDQSQPREKRPLLIRKKVALTDGENRIGVMAYNAAGMLASEPAVLTIPWKAVNLAPPKLFVMAVAVNDYYDSRLRLAYAVPDARALADAFKRGGEKLYGGVDVTVVADNDVTAANLDKIFADLSKRIGPQDVFMFFAAGHGKTVSGRYYYLPYDFRYEGEESIIKNGLDQDRFQKWLAMIPARKSILLYDTCESGSLTSDKAASRGIERIAALDRLTRSIGRTVLSASTDDAPALEGYKGHGVFSYVLLDGIGAGDANSDGMVDITELAGFVDSNVPNVSYDAFKMRQIPQMKIVGSNYPLLASTNVLGAEPDSISTKPTHVVIADVTVKAEADDGSSEVTRLTPGSQVTLVQSANGGWVLIGREGRKLGYVRETSLILLQ